MSTKNDISCDRKQCGLQPGRLRMWTQYSSAEIVSISEVLKVSVWEGRARQKMQRNKDAMLLECCLGLKERPRCVCLGVCAPVCVRACRYACLHTE